MVIPPIKSQGIKTKLVPWIKETIPTFTGKYIEPFLGTGCVAFNCASGRPALLCDTNPHIIEFYDQVKEKRITSESMRGYLMRESSFLRESGDLYYKFVRDRFNREFSPYDFIFLSRAGFNGMMRFNGKGKWNIPFCHKPNRFDKSYVTKICNQVEAVSNMMTDDWEFKRQSFEDTIMSASRDDFIYLDPPYHGRHVDYYNGWSDSDEVMLFELLCKTNAKFILSTWRSTQHRENEMVGKYWSKFNTKNMDHFYHNGANLENRKPVVESLFFNF